MIISRIVVGFLSIFSLALVATSVCHALPQSDFDTDGTSDVFSTTGTTTLSWSALGSTSGTDELAATSFGLATDTPAPAQWENAGVTALAVIRQKQGSTTLVWKILNGSEDISQFEFGRAGDVILSGADFDGNGIADAAVAHFNSKDKLLWNVLVNPLTEAEPKTYKFVLGQRGDRAFYLNAEGTSDWVGVFGLGKNKKTRMILRNVLSGETKTIRGLPRSLAKGARPRPFPIAGGDDVDNIGFITTDETDTTVQIFDITGAVVRSVTLPGLGTAFVGDYNPSAPGEEFGLQTSSKITLVNGEDGTKINKTIVTGTPLDEVQVVQIGG